MPSKFLLLLANTTLVLTFYTQPLNAEVKGSFSPISLNGDNGKPMKLTWTYQINDGKSLYFAQSVYGRDIKLKFQPGDLVVSIDPTTLKRIVKFSTKVSGSASGQIGMRITESLQPNTEGKILVTQQDVALTGTISVQSIAVSITAKLLSQLTPASEWFLDRNDLDLLPVGTTSGDNQEINASVTGSVCASASGQKQCENLDTSYSALDQWQVVGHSDQLTVKKVSYVNIVQVDRQTVVPAMEGLIGGSANTQTTTSHFWVAKGVGLIKGSGQYRFLGQDLSVELKSTAITLPKIAKLNRLVDRAGATSLTISGTGFGKAAGKVVVGGQSAQVISWKNTAIKTELPITLAAGAQAVKVERNNGVQSASSKIVLP